MHHRQLQWRTVDIRKSTAGKGLTTGEPTSAGGGRGINPEKTLIYPATTGQKKIIIILDVP